MPEQPNPPQADRGWTKVPNAILRDTDLPAGPKLLYAIMLSYAWEGATCWPSQATLAACLALSIRATRRYLQHLHQIGLIASTRRGDGQTTLYRLLPLSDRPILSPLNDPDRTETTPLNPSDRPKEAHPPEADRPKDAPLTISDRSFLSIEEDHDDDDLLNSSSSSLSSSATVDSDRPETTHPPQADRPRSTGLQGVLLPQPDLVAQLATLGFVDAKTVIDQYGADRVATGLATLASASGGRPKPQNPGGWLRTALANGTEAQPIKLPAQPKAKEPQTKEEERDREREYYLGGRFGHIIKH